MPALEVRCDLLIGGGSGADGFSFSYSDYDGGTVSEVGDSTPGLAVGIVTYSGGTPRIQLAYNGTVFASQNYTSAQLRPNSYQPFTLSVSDQGLVRASYNGFVVSGTAPGWNPQSSWDIILGARVGGANDNHLVDNLVISGTAPRTSSITRLDSNPRNIAGGTSARWQVIFSDAVQNVDGTDFTVTPVVAGVGHNAPTATGPAITVSNNFSSNASPGTLSGTAAVTGGSLHLTEANNGQGGTWSYSPGVSAPAFRSTFNLLIGNGNGADGFGFHYGPNNEGGVAFEGNGAGLSVVFDTYDNGGEGTPNITIRYNGADLAVVPRTLRTGGFVPVIISVTTGGICTVYHNIALVASAVIPSWSPAASWDFAVSAATGGLNDQHYVDDLSIRSSVYEATVANLSGTGEIRLDVSGGNNITDFMNPYLNVLSPSTFTSGQTYVVDLVAPDVVLAGTPGVTNASFSVTATLTETSTTFTSADVTPNNATITDFTGSGTNYSFTVNPIADGAAGATVNAGVFTDAAGNGNANTVSFSRTYDGTPPTPVLNSASGSSVNGAITVTVNTGETTVDFTSGDVTPSNASVTGFTGSGSSYSFTLNPQNNGSFGVTIAAGNYTDAAGNASTGPVTLTRTYDTLQPTPVISSLAADPTNAAITVQVNTGEVTTDFTSSDVDPLNANISAFTGSGISYSFTLSPIADGAFGVTIDPASYTDAAGNGNTGPVIFSRTYDSTAPTPTLNTAAPAMVNGAIAVTVDTGESTANFIAADLSPTLVNASISAFSGSGTSYSFTLTPQTDGPFSVSVPGAVYTDAAGNANNPSGVLSRTFDGTAPTPVLSSLAGNPVTGAITVTVSTGEATSNLIAGDVTPTNANVTGFTGSGDTYSFTLTPQNQGAFSAQVAAGAYTDAAGNGNTGPVSISRNYDSVAPAIQTRVPSAGTTVASLTTISVTFTESVTGVSAAALTVDGSPATTITGSGAGPYAFGGWANPGTGPAAVILDGAGIVDSASNELVDANWSYTINTSVPSVTLASVDVSDGATENAAFYTFTANWSEAVSGFAAGDVQVANGAVSNFTGSGASYSFRVTPGADGAVTVQVPANRATATAPPNNQNAASGVFSFTHDATPPVITLNGLPSDATSCGDGYSDPGVASALDVIAGDLTALVVVSGDTILVNSSPFGSPYEIVYTVSDPAGNVAQATRSVTVLDDCPLQVVAGGSGETEFTVDPGMDITLQVVVSGAIGTPVYDWQRDDGAKAWQSLGTASSPNLVLTDLGPSDAGEYRCVVSDDVTVEESPVFTIQLNAAGVPVAGVLALGALASALVGLGIRRKRGA